MKIILQDTALYALASTIYTSLISVHYFGLVIGYMLPFWIYFLLFFIYFNSKK